MGDDMIRSSDNRESGMTGSEAPGEAVTSPGSIPEAWHKELLRSFHYHYGLRMNREWNEEQCGYEG